MAVTPPTDAAFLREVDEELRRDELAKAWRRYGIAAIGAVIVAVLAWGGWLLWQSYQLGNSGAEGEALSKAFDEIGSATPDAANASLDKLKGSSISGYRALALMTQADLALQKQNLPGAAALFAQVAGDAKVAQPLRDLALIRQTSAEFDTLKPEQVVSRLRGLASKGSPWFASAGELVAVSYLRMNRRDLAGQMFSEIARADGATEAMRLRAAQMAGVLGVDAVAQPRGQSEDNIAK